VAVQFAKIKPWTPPDWDSVACTGTDSASEHLRAHTEPPPARGPTTWSPCDHAPVDPPHTTLSQSAARRPHKGPSGPPGPMRPARRTAGALLSLLANCTLMMATGRVHPPPTPLPSFPLPGFSLSRCPGCPWPKLPPCRLQHSAGIFQDGSWTGLAGVLLNMQACCCSSQCRLMSASSSVKSSKVY
jgi:hypothetical protein